MKVNEILIYISAIIIFNLDPRLKPRRLNLRKIKSQIMMR
jgi:hypothetical protein